MATLVAPQIAAPTAQKSAPLFLGTPQISDRVKLLFDNLELSELQRRALLAYSMTNEELVEDLLNTPRELIRATPHFTTPQALMKELSVAQSDGTWYVTDGLSQIKAVADSEQHAYTLLGLMQTEDSRQ